MLLLCQISLAFLPVIYFDNLPTNVHIKSVAYLGCRQGEANGGGQRGRPMGRLKGRPKGRPKEEAKGEAKGEVKGVQA